MSAVSSPAPASSTSDSTSPDTGTSGSANATPSDASSSTNDSPASPSTPTSSPSAPTPGQLELISSQAGSPARASVARAGVTDSGIPRLRFGERCSESFASFDPTTSSWRTSQTSLLSDLLEASPELCLAKYSEGWPRAGTTLNGTAFRLPPSAPRTAAIGSSSRLLPTPCSRDWKGEGWEGTLMETLPRLLPTQHGIAKEAQPRKPGPTGNMLGR